MSEQTPESASSRKSTYMRELEADIYWGIGSAAFRDPCGVNVPVAYSPEPRVEDVEDGYLLSVNLETGELTTKKYEMVW